MQNNTSPLAAETSLLARCGVAIPGPLPRRGTTWSKGVSSLLLLGRLGVLLVGLSLIANCAPPVDVESELEFGTEELLDAGSGAVLAERLRGGWELTTSSPTTDCPQELAHRPMEGFTEWDSEDNQVWVEWLDGHGLLEMWAVNGETLRAVNSIERYGCEVTQEITLSIVELTSLFVSAHLFIEYYHNEAETCELGAALYDLPDGCEATVDWAGYRFR